MASYKALRLLFCLFFITFAHEHLDEEYTCSHDDQDHEPLFEDVDEDMSAVNSTAPESNEDYDEDHNARMLASSRYRSIRMYPYFGFLEQSASSSFVRYVRNELVPPVISYFEAALKIKYPISNLRLSSRATRVCERPTPSILRRGVSADYFIYFDSFASSSSQVANSKYCYLSSGSRRPIVTRTRFNRNMFRDARGNVLVHEKNTYLLIHEMLHTLGFSGSMYKYFVDSNGRTRRGHLKSVSIAGRTRQVLDVPPLTQRLRNFYGCSSLPGAILENQGGSGTSSSHFERKYFVYETMSSGGIYGRRVSEFSLALLEGSGWYAVNYDYAEPFFYGKGQGCSFIHGKCSSSRAYFDEYCTGSSRGCAPHGRSGGKCRSDSISDGCRYYYPDVDYDCDNSDAEDYTRLPQLQVFGRGSESKCFTGDLNSRRSSSRTSFCFKYACSGSGSNTELEVYIGNHKVTCTREGKRSVDGYYGSIDCPDPETFCQGAGKKYCPRGCMGRGTCVNNKCHCRSGYKGIDCGLRS